MNSPKTIDYKVGQDNVQIFGLDIHNPVFVISGVITVLVAMCYSTYVGLRAERA